MDLIADIGPVGLALTAAIVFAGALVQGAIGMGFGLLAAPLLALVDQRLVPALVLTLGFFSTLYPAWRLRAEIVPRELALGIAGRVAGAAVAGASFAYVLALGLDAVRLIFGITVLAAVLLSLSRLRVALTDANLFLASILSGLMGTFTGIGAPPMGLLYQHQDAAKVRATLNAYFGCGSVISLVSLTSFGAMGTGHLAVAAAMAPALVAGVLAAGRIVHPPGARLRGAILIICAASSVILILRGLGVT